MKVTVVGSINMDLVVYSDEIPAVGETVMGHSLMQNPGGKGANQAVAMAKLGLAVDFLGKVGSDSYAPQLLDSMQAAGVNTERIAVETGNSGIAVIHVDSQGHNNIVVIAGANAGVDDAYLRAHQAVFQPGDMALFQLEIPLESVKIGLQLAKAAGTTTILNPAPAAELDDELLAAVDILIPNEHELARLSGLPVDSEAEIIAASQKLMQRGIGELIVTLGERGVLHIDQQGSTFYPANQVAVVDTTAAGDSFIGGLLTALAQAKTIPDAIDYGQRAAALTIQRKGAQSALPSAAELEGDAS